MRRYIRDGYLLWVFEYNWRVNEYKRLYVILIIRVELDLLRLSQYCDKLRCLHRSCSSWLYSVFFKNIFNKRRR